MINHTRPIVFGKSFHVFTRLCMAVTKMRPLCYIDRTDFFTVLGAGRGYERTKT